MNLGKLFFETRDLKDLRDPWRADSWTDIRDFTNFFKKKLLKHYLHNVQYKAITGATYYNTIYITYTTKQYDYLFNLQDQFMHYLQKLYEYIGYLHSYYNNGQQNKNIIHLMYGPEGNS